MPKKKTKAKNQKTKTKTKKRVVAKKKKVAAKKKAMKPAKKKATKASSLGKVVHYYDRIGVAIVELARPLSVGDRVLFKRGVQELTQKITSMQIEHAMVPSAKKGDVVGVQVQKEVQKGAIVTPA
jgi:hypothetical protein